jgi:hypothetical protein
MKIRTDSVFANLTEQDQQNLLAMAKNMTAVQIAELVTKRGLPCNARQMRKLLRRLENADLADAQGVDDEILEKMDGGGHGLREVALATARSRMLRIAAKADDNKASSVYKTLTAEKHKEQQLALDARRVRALEESASLGWKRLELERAIAAAKLLPKVWSIITDTTIDEKERLARAHRCLAKQASAFIEAPPAAPQSDPLPPAQPANVSGA